jgi:hypothetical protein
VYENKGNVDKLPANKRTFAALVPQSSDILCGMNTDLPESTPFFAGFARTARDVVRRPAAAVSPAFSARVGQGRGANGVNAGGAAAKQVPYKGRARKGGAFPQSRRRSRSSIP